MSVSYGKPYKGIGMEGALGSWYARNTRRDIAEFGSLAARLPKEIAPGSRILEVAPGPGYLSIELAKLASTKSVTSTSANPSSRSPGKTLAANPCASIFAVAMRPQCPLKTTLLISSFAAPRSRISRSRSKQSTKCFVFLSQAVEQ